MPDETEHKRAEKAIKELGNYLHQIINRIGDPVFVKDQQLRFVLVNDALCAILGKTREEIIGTTGWEYLPKEEMAVFRKQDNLVLETGEENLNEENLTDAEGKAHRIHTKKTLYTDNDGNKFLIGVIRDITERKRAELLQNAVYQISRAAEKATGLDDLFRGVHKIVSTVMEAGNFYISLYDKGKGVLTFPYFVDEVDTPPPPSKLEKGLTEYVLRTGESLLCDRVKDQELCDRGEVEMVGAPSAIWLGVPLKIDKETIGVMVVQHYSSPNAYGPQELRMLEYVSSQVARSIERKRTEEALRDLVRQKEILMKELQHRVKNSLAIVSSLLGLEMDDLADAKSRAVFVNARSRIRSIGSLYERLYLASDIDNVDLGAYIRELAESLFKTFAPGNVRLTTRLDEVRLDTKRAAPLGLILNELVTNALKYAYPGGAKGEVCVGLEKSADTVTLSVADDGVGLPDGFDPETSGGMGTSLVRMLAGEIDGTLSYEGRKGTRVSIRLKP